MKQRLVTILFVIFAVSVFGQIQIDDRSGYSLKERGYLGIGLGNIGFGSGAFGNYYIIGISPQAGYMVNSFVSSGLAFDYQYTGYPSVKQHSTLYGWYPYVRFNIKRFFVQVDYDTYWAQVSGTTDRKTFNRFPVGLGYFTQGNGRGGMNFLVSYDAVWSGNSPWSTPLSIRVFVTF